MLGKKQRNKLWLLFVSHLCLASPLPPAGSPPQLGNPLVTFGNHRFSFSFLLLLIFHHVALAHNMSDILTVFYNYFLSDHVNNTNISCVHLRIMLSNRLTRSGVCN